MSCITGLTYSSMKVIVVGAGGTARELLRRLGEAWDVTLIDKDPDRLKLAAAVRSFTPVEGDGSSPVVLGEAGLLTSDALVACTNSDEVNLAACKLAIDADVFRIGAMAADPERLVDYQTLGIAAHSPDSLTARWLELDLEPRRVASMAFAGGRAEAIELEVASDSPVAGKALKDLPVADWLVGVIHRDNDLIIPHGDDVLKVGDRVTVVGPSRKFGEIIGLFTSGQARFPLDYGSQVVVPMRGIEDLESLFAEAVYVTRNSIAKGLVVVHREGEDSSELIDRAARLATGVEVRFQEVSGRAIDHVPEVATDVGGLIVVPELSNRPRWLRFTASREARLAYETGVPVLIARGSFPYREILVPARPTPAGRAAIRAAVDLARLTKAELTGLAVIDATFIAGPDVADEARAAAARLKEQAAVQGVSVRRKVRRGNPIRVFLEFSTDLTVLGMRQRSVGVRIAEHIARDSRSSVLLVPTQ